MVRAHGKLLHIFSVLNVEIVSAKLESISSLLSLESSTSASVVRKSGPIWGHSRRLQREGCQDPGLGKGIWHPFYQDDNFPKHRVQSVWWKKPIEKKIEFEHSSSLGDAEKHVSLFQKTFPQSIPYSSVSQVSACWLRNSRRWCPYTLKSLRLRNTALEQAMSQNAADCSILSHPTTHTWQYIQNAIMEKAERHKHTQRLYMHLPYMVLNAHSLVLNTHSLASPSLTDI